MINNILTIDLEEYFHANNVAATLPSAGGVPAPSRIVESTDALLAFLAEYRIEATFFVLGKVAESHPELVGEIERRGHEIATHGYSHALLTSMTPQTFEQDLRKALAVTQPCVKQPIIGYRAPSFTIVPSTRWALEVLEKVGLRYDSSIFPIGFHPDYGMPGAPAYIHAITPRLTEVPISCVDIAGIRFPCTGGGYFRLLPYFMSRVLYRMCNRNKRPFVFYLHPWEIDSAQPRFNMPLTRQFRQYLNIGRTMHRLHKLVRDFQFTSIRSVLAA
jgi:polysaccharide deacetylase family protein (PEP-CTERM system associated)